MTLDLHLPKAKGLFVTGTDTGVGKTLIAGGIARLLTQQGLRVGVFKPVASGCRSDRGELFSQDAAFLAACAETDYPLSVISPVTFRTPAAPITCIRLEHRPMDYEQIAAAYTWLCEKCDAVVVEGIGGAMVPLTETETVLDLAAEFDLPTLVVARPTLGTINHSLLTIRAVRDAGLPLAGVIINGYNALDADIAEETAPEVIAQIGQTTILAIVPYDEGASVEEGRLGRAVPEALGIWDWKSLIQC
jgi:dethiobiotin synthetase